jgi:hypothetical protein
LTHPFCSRSNELCAHHREYECHRRWSRPLPENVGKENCPGFLRDAAKASIVHEAKVLTGRRIIFLDEAVRELSMAHRLEEVTVHD